jgi:DNA-binding transcriptional MerR regulator
MRGSENNLVMDKSISNSEFAEIINIGPHVIQYWESEFTTIKSIKLPNGKRLYPIISIGTHKRVKYLIFK